MAYYLIAFPVKLLVRKEELPGFAVISIQKMKGDTIITKNAHNCVACIMCET